MSKCPGLNGAMVDGVCYYPSTPPCASTPGNPVNQIVIDNNEDGTGYCIPHKKTCPMGFTLGVVDSTGDENGCYYPAACSLARSGQYCHAVNNTVSETPCDPRETTFEVTTDKRQHVHVCAAYPSV